MYNNVYEIVNDIAISVTYEELKNTVERMLCDINALYSYFVGKKSENILIKICYSDRDDYNTITREDAEDDIINKIADYLITLSDKKCITFRQPPIELLVELYEPMLMNMATKVQLSWSQFELDDLKSIATYCMIKLYNDGYYINKYLIWTSFKNTVLMECRKHRFQTNILSYEETFLKGDEDNELTYADVARDWDEEERKAREEEEQCNKWIFEQVKEIIIEKIGVRQWDQLYRDYSKNHTTNASRKLMYSMKEYLKELGFTRKDFIDIYRR